MTELFIKQDEKYSNEIKKEINNTNKLISHAESIIDNLLSHKQLKPIETPPVVKAPLQHNDVSINKHNKILEYLKKINKCSKINNSNLLIIKNNTDKNIINSKIIEIKKCINIILNYIHKLKNNIYNM